MNTLIYEFMTVILNNNNNFPLKVNRVFVYES